VHITNNQRNIARFLWIWKVDFQTSRTIVVGFFLQFTRIVQMHEENLFFSTKVIYYHRRDTNYQHISIHVQQGSGASWIKSYASSSIGHKIISNHAPHLFVRYLFGPKKSGKLINGPLQMNSLSPPRPLSVHFFPTHWNFGADVGQPKQINCPPHVHLAPPISHRGTPHPHRSQLSRTCHVFYSPHSSSPCAYADSYRATSPTIGHRQPHRLGHDVELVELCSS
jgi:hypothetical protein